MQRGDVIWLNLDYPPLAVSGGHEQRNTRPFILVSLGSIDSQNPMLTVVPLTTKMNKSRYPHTFTVQPSIQNGLQAESVVLAFQVTSYGKERLIRVAGSLEAEYIQRLDQMLKRLMRL